MGGGIGLIEMYKTSNILALVGGGHTPKYQLNKVIIWDENEAGIVAELRVNNKVLNIKMKFDRIIVVTDRKIYVFDMENFDVIDIIKTAANHLGLYAISSSDKINVIAFPIKRLSDDSKGEVGLKSYECNILKHKISAHESNLSFLAINNKGTLLATASQTGTLIRVFAVYNGEFLQELRRGTYNSTISCIAFESNDKFLVCSSNSSTIHVFSLSESNKALINLSKKNSFSGPTKESGKSKIEPNETEPKNKKSLFSGLSGLSKLMDKLVCSQWSFAKLHIEENNGLVRFIKENTIAILASNGKIYTAYFDNKNGGDCKSLNHKLISTFSKLKII